MPFLYVLSFSQRIARLRRCVYFPLRSKSIFYWDVTSNTLIGHRRFGGTFSLHLHSLCFRTLLVGYLLGLLFDSGDRGIMLLRNIDFLPDYTT
jgi:hypothetical protein